MSIIKIIVKNLKYYFKLIFMFMKDIIFKKNNIPSNILIKIKMNLRGFTSDQYHLYNLSSNNINDYISELDRIKTRNLAGDYKLLLDDKLIFHNFFDKKLKMASLLFYVSNGKLYDKDGILLNDDSFFEILSKHEKIIVKHKKGYGGKGVFLIEYQKDKFIINDTVKNKHEAYLLMTGLNDFIAESVVTQHHYSNKIYSKSVNTLRLLTMYSKKNNQVYIPAAMHRFGTDSSAPVDNASSGGIFSRVEISTGELSGARDYMNNSYSFHPDSLEAIEGIVIPNWNELLAKVECLAKKYPYIPFMAWDIVVSDDNEFVVLEINASTGFTFIQMWGGLKQTKVYDFYKEYEIL